MAIAPYGYSQELWDEISPEAKAVVERPEAQRLGRAQDTRDFLGDDIQTFEKLGETGSTWGGKKVSYQAYDAQGRPTQKFTVDESGLQKGMQIAAQMAASMIPMAGAGAAIGAAMGIPAQFATHFGNAVLSGGMSALGGGDFVKGAVAGGLGSYASPYISDFAKTAGQAVGGDALGKIVSGAVEGAGRSAVGAAATGSNIVDALLSGAAGGATSAGTDILVKGTNSTLGEYLKDVPAPVRNAVTSAATAGLLGKDPDRAAINAFIGTLTKSSDSPFKPAAKTADATTQQLLDIFGTPQDTGRVLDQVAGEIPSGMFDTEAEDYIRSLINFEEALPPDVTEFLPAQEVIRERISLEDRYPAPEGTVTDTSSSEPADQRFDITANLPGLNEDFTLEDLLPGTGSSTQRTVNVSEDKPAQVEITGKRDTTIPDYTQDLFPPIDPISIRDVGPVTKIEPDEKLEGTEIKEKDLAEDLKPVTTVTTKTDTTKTTTDKKNEIDWAKLFALLSAMNRPQERQEQYQLANMPDYEDLMYGMSSGEMPYMRG